MTHAAHAQTLRLRLFLEGIEVPVIAANIQTAPNSPSVATIQVPPLAEATRLHPRTMVHLFFLDLYKSSPAINDTGRTSEDGGQRSANDYERERIESGYGEDAAIFAGLQDQQNDQWRMLFGGEIVGFTWTKNTHQRSVILQCEDWSNYWDYAFQANNTGIFGPALKAVFAGASTNLFTDFLRSEGEVITNIVTSGRCNTFPKLKGLAAGIIRLVEAIGGSYYINSSDGQKPPKRRAGSNAFFSYNELRLHLTQMIGTFEDDPTSSRIMRRSGYGGMFRRTLGGQGGQVSIRRCMTALTRIIFYEMYPQPCPKYKPGSFGSPTGTRRIKMADHPTYDRFSKTADEAVLSLFGMQVDMNRFVEEEDFPPPATGSTATDPFSYNERLRRLMRSLSRQLGEMRRLLLRTASQMRNAPRDATGAMSTAAQKVGTARERANSLASNGATTTATSADKTLSMLNTLIDEAMEELEKVGKSEVLAGTGQDRRPAQLFQQVFRPDVWFAAPPRCNVLFPELYDSFSYQRTFLKEPTRFLLKTNDEHFGEDVLFDKFYFAPQAGGRSAKMREIRKGKLLDHEKFTGILPVFEKMGEFNIFASRAERRAGGIKKIGLAQRSANFLYFRHRFNARRAQVGGKFNPYVAVGCPGLVIDKYIDRETIERHNELRREANVPEIEAGQILGTNFLGNFTQVVHQISQAQPLGRTDITMTFPRQPDESVEFLGALQDEEATVKKRVEGGDAIRSVDVAAIGPPQLFSLGPNRGRITQVQDVSDQYPEGRELEIFFTGARRNTQFRPSRVPVGIQVTAAILGNDETVAAILGGNDVLGVFNAYRVTEEIPRYRREEVTLPAEEYIRPGWYGEVWTNSQIGKVWQELFSTGAITDPTQVTDRGRNSASLRSEESKQAAAEKEDATSPDDPEATAPALLDLEEGASLQQAVEFLHLNYSYIRQAGMDTDEFIGAYTWRPIASMLDIFGTGDLQYDNDGLNIIQGWEGFHSRAVGPYDNLFGLVTEEVEGLLDKAHGPTATQSLDVRKARREQVEKYLTSLLFGNAILG